MFMEILGPAAVGVVMVGLLLAAVHANRTGYLVAAAGYVVTAFDHLLLHKPGGAILFGLIAVRMYYLWKRGGGGGGWRVSIQLPRRAPVLT